MEELTCNSYYSPCWDYRVKIFIEIFTLILFLLNFENFKNILNMAKGIIDKGKNQRGNSSPKQIKKRMFSNYLII